MVRRPRLVDAEGKEVPLKHCARMRDPGTLDATASRRVSEVVAQRRVDAGLARDQPPPQEQRADGASKSSVSRRWIAATVETLAAQAERRLEDLGWRGLDVTRVRTLWGDVALVGRSRAHRRRSGPRIRGAADPGPEPRAPGAIRPAHAPRGTLQRARGGIAHGEMGPLHPYPLLPL